MTKHADVSASTVCDSLRKFFHFLKESHARPGMVREPLSLCFGGCPDLFRVEGPGAERYPVHMREILLVGCGGFIGSVVRFLVGLRVTAAAPEARFPWGTFAVNLAGCFLIGLLAGRLDEHLRPLVITGFLGGFTTFSAFGLETLLLLRSGEWMLALGYALASVVLGVLFAALGMAVVGSVR